MKSDGNAPETSFERSQRRMNSWLLTFNDKELERNFRSSWLDATRIQILYWKTGAIFYYLSITLVLQSYAPPHQQYLMDLRLFVGLPLIIVSMLPPLFHKHLKWWSSPSYTVSVVVIFGISCLQLRSAGGPNDYLFLFDLTVIYVFAQHYNRAFFVHNVMLIAGLSLAAGISTYGFGGSSLAVDVPFVPFVLTLAGIAMVGVFASYTREFFVRRNYLAQHRLRAEKARAEQLAIDATQALEAKSRFLAIVGHELRTPLNAIIGFSELVLNGVGGEVKSAKTRDYIGDINQSGQHLLGLVESVLDYTQAGSGMIRVNEEVIAPRQLVENVCAQIQHMLTIRHQVVMLDLADDLPELRIDARQVSQCLANLLSNASKFSAVGSEIRCAARLSKDGGVEITVTDSGPGLGDANLELLFDPFAQGEDGLSRTNEGLGIGLPLTRALMRAHDGDVRLATCAGIGTVATLAFPVGRSQPRSPQSMVGTA